MKEIAEQEVLIKLKNLYDNSEETIKSEAIIRRAYIDRVSQEVINEKVNAQLNAIKAGIYDINPKFKEGSKNYDTTKKLVSETLTNYEQVLRDLSEFFDTKIEQLILRKVELEASLVGAIMNEEYLRDKIARKNQQKENDAVKNSVKDNIRNALETIKNCNEINPLVIAKILDQQDVVTELDQKLSDRIDKSVRDKSENKIEIDKYEKEISMINSEINRINERKKKSIYEAMEVGSRSMTINIRRPKVFKKITRFFTSKFNTSKLIETTIISPLNIRIENFKLNELSSMKG